MVVPTESGGGPLLPKFYAGRSILITGGSGFLGKVLIERLLSTCPDVDEVFLLMRSKRGQEPLKRLAQLKQSQAFDNIRARCPWQLDKLRVVSGDVAQPRLGLDDSALTQLQGVSVVFHNAATIKFWETLQTALHHNVSSIIALMDLCDELPKLEALVHVSTAYTNSEHCHIEERVYPAPVPLASLRAMVDTLPPPLLEEITTKFISPKQNTYVFSKAVAESMIDTRAGRQYAAAIVRPSVVVSAHRDPYPGWVENLSGASGVVIGIGKGLVHTFNLKEDARADLIPVDVTIDTLLAVAWEIATDRYVYKTLELILQTTPLYVADYIAKACGVKLKLSLVTTSERLQAANRVLAFFATREWKFETGNVQHLRNRLSRQDRIIYNLDVRVVNWGEHVSNFVKGARKYLLMEKDDKIPEAKKSMKRLRLIHHVVLFIISMLIYRFLIHKFFLEKVEL